MAAKKADPKYQFDLRMRCVEAAVTLTIPGPGFANGRSIDIIEKAGEFYNFVINGDTTAG